MQKSPEQFAIRVNDLVVGFRQKTVIDHLSLDVRRDEILDMMHRPRAAGKDRERRGGERLQGALLGVDEVGPHLTAGRPVDAQPRDGAIPVPQKRILRVQTVEASALERVAFDVTAAAFLLAVFLRVARLRRQRREAPMRGEREIDLVTVGIVEARADDGGFEIVVTNHERHAAEIPKRAFV